MLSVVPPDEPAEKAARALLGASEQASRECPAPGCGRPLTGRQRACSGKCRAALSRLRREEGHRAALSDARELLEAALRRLGQARV
jgi:uncharacterized membrane protein YccC